MKEQELNTLMSVVSDPINNVYKINSYQDLAEIQRIIRIFNISEEQHNKHAMLSIKNLSMIKPQQNDIIKKIKLKKVRILEKI